MNNFIKENNFMYIPEFISSERAIELAKQFRNFCKMNNQPGDSQVENSSATYNYIAFLELLCEKTPEVSRFLGETVLPTYTYARVYEKGAVLDPHKDREACEISLTLHLIGDKEWPIYITKPNGESVYLNLKSGDAMMYLGCDAEHWREQFEGSEYIQVFLHYVKSRGENNFAFFDNKKDSKDKIAMDHFAIENHAPTPKEQIKKAKSLSRNLEDYIIKFPNAIPHDLCDAIIKEYSNTDLWQSTTIGKNLQVDTTIRDVNTILISREDIIGLNYDVRKELDNRVFVHVNEAMKKYNEKFSFALIDSDSGYELLRYNVGQKYVQHVDHFKEVPRTISCIIGLNDEYEGGEFTFFDKELSMKVEKGTILMFPSNFQYPHSVEPVTAGTRYSIVTWLI